MAISDTLLKILVCPETKTAVSLAPQTVLDAVNERIRRGEARNRAGTQITSSLSAALIRADGKRIYPIVDDIPVMLIDEAIDL